MTAYEMRISDWSSDVCSSDLRFVQERVDQAYAEGIKLLRAGRLNIRLSEQEALGNFIDRRVRSDLRRRYHQYGIDAAGKGPVRVNRRENDSSGSELSFRLPDISEIGSASCRERMCQYG